MILLNEEYEAVKQAVRRHLPQSQVQDENGDLKVTKIADHTFLVTARINYPQSVESPHFHVSRDENSPNLRVRQISPDEFERHLLAYNIFFAVQLYAINNQAIGRVPQEIAIRETEPVGKVRRFSALSNDSLRADVFCLNVYTVSYDTEKGTFTVDIELSRLRR